MPPIVLLAVLVTVLVATGSTADRAGFAAGRAFTVTTSTGSASGGPYPGWYYGLPILLTMAVLVASVVIALRRTALLAAISSDEAVDRAWRTAVGRTVVAIATSGLLLYIAGVLWASGVVWRVLEQTGSTGFTEIAVVQAAAAQLAGLAAVILLAASAVRITAIGRVVLGRPVVP